jgi:S1-C subfamily serine protease
MLKIQTLVACLALLSGTPASLSALSIPEIVSKAKPAVLKITAYDSTGKPLRFGTGFFISDDGELVTNRHVIEDASTVTAETASGASYACEGALLEPKDLDLVMLKFKARGVEKLVFGDASKITEGQKVVVIGNPEGLEGTISEGIIAAIRDKPHLIQITAPISPGSSGSPVLDETGQVIGIATLAFKEGQNLNFAIPSDEVTRALALITKDAQVTPLTESHGGNSEGGQVIADLQAIEDLEKQHKESEALKMVAQFLRDHPADAKAWSLKAKILAGLNLAAEAVEAQKMAIKFDTDSAAVWADMTFYLSLFAAGTPKPNGIESEIRSAAEHAIALGDDHEMTWDLLVWACGATRDSAAAKKYAATRDERIGRVELELRARALSDLITGDYARVDLDRYASEHSLTLALEPNKLTIRGDRADVKLVVEDPNSPYFGMGKPVPFAETGNALLEVDTLPGKSKNGHWYISQHLITSVLEPILGNPILTSGPTRAYLAPLPGLTKQDQIATDRLIREIIAENPESFASFSVWKRSTASAVVVFCSYSTIKKSTELPKGWSYIGRQQSQQVDGFFDTGSIRDVPESTLLQISVQNALPDNNWLLRGGITPNRSVELNCPAIWCRVSANQDVSNRSINDVKTAFVKGLNTFNARLAEIASARNKNAAPDKSTFNSQQPRQ